MVPAWPEPPFAIIAGVRDGVEALALDGAPTEMTPHRPGKLVAGPAKCGRFGSGREFSAHTTGMLTR
jgi:hypothetical protein